MNNETGDSKSSSPTPNDGVSCPECDSQNVITVHEEKSFPYEVGNDVVQISVTLPFRVCHDCGAKWMDAEGEEIEHNAVCRHLRVMTPKEIVRLRKSFNLSRAEFARTTRIGEATLARWEKGALIQNYGYDQLLYLLQKFPFTLNAMKERQERGVGGLASSRASFRCIDRTESLEQQAQSFALRGTRASR